MSVLPPPGSRLGTLRMDTVLQEYEGPVLFVARDDLGHAYLALATDEDETGDVFTYVPVSERRLVAIRTGLVSLRDAVAEPEGTTLFVVRPDIEPGRVEAIASGALPAEWLPEQGFALSERLETVHSFSDEWLSDLSRAEGRFLTALEFDQPALARRTEFPLGLAGQLLTEFQEMTRAFALYERPPRPQGVGQSDVLREAELGLVQLAAASFVFIVAPLTDDRLIQVDVPAVQQAARVLDAADDASFVESIRELKPRTISHLRSFLGALSDASTGMRLVNAQPSGARVAVEVKRPSIDAKLGILRSRSQLPSIAFTMEGHLLALDLIGLTFTAVESRATENRTNPRRIKGQFLDDLLPSLDGVASLGQSITYEFDVVREQDRANYGIGSKPKTRHRLVALRLTQEQVALGTGADDPQPDQ